jgi:hypothetical protein
MMKLIAAFREFVNVPKIYIIISYKSVQSYNKSPKCFGLSLPSLGKCLTKKNTRIAN